MEHKGLQKRWESNPTSIPVVFLCDRCARFRKLNGEKRTDFGRDARGLSGRGADGHPDRSGLRKQGMIVRATHFGEAFERDPGGFADPGAQDNFVAKAGWRFVVDLVA